jgi:hypothetical protein
MPLSAAGQVNPVPFVNQPLVPTAVAPGGPSFTLTVNGTGFVSDSVVNWNATPRPTTFVSSSQLTATIDAADIVLAKTVGVTAVSPSPGGGTSNVVFFQITVPSSSVRFVGGWGAFGTYGVATGDFNGDGNLDVAATGGDLGNSVSVFVVLGNGDGTAQSPAAYALSGKYVSDIIAQDFNGDGKLDLAVADGTYAAGGVGRNVSILLGNGDGTFQSPVDYATERAPVALAAADFNRDGKLDLVVANYFYYVVSVLLGNGDGTFQPYQTFFVPPGPDDVAVGDFNRDDNMDIAVCGHNTISALLGTGAGTFAPVSTTTFGDDGLFTSLSVADLNGDGKLDLAIGGMLEDGTTVLATTFGNGNGTFQPLVHYILDYQPYSVAAGDLNGDGTLDLAVLPSIFLGNEDGTFQPIDSQTVSSPVAIAVGDFNGDGRLDVAVPGGVLLQPSFVQIWPGSVGFGTLKVGTTSAERTVTLTNNLSGPLTIASVALTGNDAADFTESNDCPISPSTLAGGASCTITVTFAPQTTGVKTAAVTISDDAPGSPQQVVNLSGTSINPAMTLSATSLDFGNQNLQTTSQPQAVALTNSGAGPLTIMSISASGDFAQTNNCGTEVAEGAQCTISITFAPATAGTRTGAATITDNAPDSPQTINLTGTGVPATLTLSTTSLTFGEQNVGTTSAEQTVTVTNSGAGPLVIFSIGASGDFPQTHNCPISPATIGPSASCTISLTFRPTGGGTRSGSLIIADNASGNPHNVSLTGTGIPPTIGISPASLEFGDQRVGTTSAAQAVTVTNTGGGPATIFSISTSAEFAQTGNCPLAPATLAVAASCSINVTFRPSARGTRTGSLTLTDNATGNPHTVSLTGNGLAPEVGLSPSALNFPDQAVGVTSPPQNVTLSNTGNTVLNITGFLVTNPFAYVSGCGATLAAGASCAITVTFTPNVAGTTYGALILSDDAPGSPQTVSLTGTTAVNFGQQPVGQTSASQMVSLANASSTTRVITGVATTGDFAQSSACGTLAAGQSCPVNLTFTPAAPGTRTGALLIADNAPGSPHVMNLTGTGMGPGVRLSAASLSFGSQSVGTTSAAQTVTLENTGNEALSITGISLGGTNSGDFAHTHDCGASLAATASCTLSVTFTPTASGARSATLTITDNASGSPHTVTLAGTGSDFSLAPAAGSSTSATVNAGQTATYRLTFAPESFSGTVAVTCGGAPARATCLVSPAPVTLDGMNAANVTVTVTTTAPSLAGPQSGGQRPPLQGPPLGKYRGLPLQMWLLALVMLASLAAIHRTKPGLKLAPPLLASALMVMLLWLACGGGGGGAPAPAPQTGTPAGIYTLTITGTAAGVSRTTSLTLKVN